MININQIDDLRLSNGPINFN